MAVEDHDVRFRINCTREAPNQKLLILIDVGSSKGVYLGVLSRFANQCTRSEMLERTRCCDGIQRRCFSDARQTNDCYYSLHHTSNPILSGNNLLRCGCLISKIDWGGCLESMFFRFRIFRVMTGSR